MEKLNAILYTGDNLREVVAFTGKSYKFDEWFKSWDEYVQYVNEHGKIFKMFFADGAHVEVLPNTWIVKVNGYNIPIKTPWPESQETAQSTPDDDRMEAIFLEFNERIQQKSNSLDRGACPEGYSFDEYKEGWRSAFMLASDILADIIKQKKQ